jgi:hypothetical protein
MRGVFAEFERAMSRERVEAGLKRARAKVDHPERAYRSAAAKYAEAASLIAAFDRHRQWQLILAQAGELRNQDDEFGDIPMLIEAIAVYRSTLLLALRSQRPPEWASTQNNLGIALRILGECESGTARLEEAVTVLTSSRSGPAGACRRRPAT